VTSASSSLSWSPPLLQPSSSSSFSPAISSADTAATASSSAAAVATAATASCNSNNNNNPWLVKFGTTIQGRYCVASARLEFDNKSIAFNIYFPDDAHALSLSLGLDVVDQWLGITSFLNAKQTEQQSYCTKIIKGLDIASDYSRNTAEEGRIRKLYLVLRRRETDSEHSTVQPKLCHGDEHLAAQDKEQVAAFIQGVYTSAAITNDDKNDSKYQCIQRTQAARMKDASDYSRKMPGCKNIGSKDGVETGTPPESQLSGFCGTQMLRCGQNVRGGGYMLITVYQTSSQTLKFCSTSIATNDSMSVSIPFHDAVQYLRGQCLIKPDANWQQGLRHLVELLFVSQNDGTNGCGRGNDCDGNFPKLCLELKC